MSEAKKNHRGFSISQHMLELNDKGIFPNDKLNNFFLSQTFGYHSLIAYCRSKFCLLNYILDVYFPYQADIEQILIIEDYRLPYYYFNAF